MTTQDRILSYLAAAQPEHFAAGAEWYERANAQAVALSEAFEVTLPQAAGVIAVLSPQCHWADNVAAATAVISTWRNGGTPADAIVGLTCYPENVSKAFRLLSDPTFGIDGHGICDGRTAGKRGRLVQCLPYRSGCQCPVHGAKVAAFYWAILGRPDGAVDVWATRAADIAFDELHDLPSDDPRRAGDPRGRHAEITAAYAAAGEHFRVPGHVAQATVWVVIRDHYLRSDGRRNGQRADLPF